MCSFSREKSKEVRFNISYERTTDSNKIRFINLSRKKEVMVKLGEGEVDKFSTGGEGVTWFTRGNEGGMSCLQQNLKEGLKKIDCQ